MIALVDNCRRYTAYAAHQAIAVDLRDRRMLRRHQRNDTLISLSTSAAAIAITGSLRRADDTLKPAIPLSPRRWGRELALVTASELPERSDYQHRARDRVNYRLVSDELTALGKEYCYRRHSDIRRFCDMVIPC